MKIPVRERTGLKLDTTSNKPSLVNCCPLPERVWCRHNTILIDEPGGFHKILDDKLLVYTETKHYRFPRKQYFLHFFHFCCIRKNIPPYFKNKVIIKSTSTLVS